jgi:hypothetical protein
MNYYKYQKYKTKYNLKMLNGGMNASPAPQAFQAFQLTPEVIDENLARAEHVVIEIKEFQISVMNLLDSFTRAEQVLDSVDNKFARIFMNITVSTDSLLAFLRIIKKTLDALSPIATKTHLRIKYAKQLYDSANRLIESDRKGYDKNMSDSKALVLIGSRTVLMLENWIALYVSMMPEFQNNLAIKPHIKMFENKLSKDLDTYISDYRWLRIKLNWFEFPMEKTEELFEPLQ